MDFDDFFDKRIKMGFYQLMSYIAVTFLFFANVSVFVHSGLLSSAIEKEWDVSANQQCEQFIAQLIFTAIGGVTAGFIGDKIGRKNPVMIGISGITISNFIASLSVNFDMYYLIKAFTGFFMGFTMPFTTTILIEITVTEGRGSYLSISQQSFPTGEILAILPVYFMFDKIQSFWRIISMLCCGVMGITALVLIYFYVDDSPRFLLQQGKFDKAIQVLNRMGKMNNKNFQEITQVEEKLIIENSQQKLKQLQKNKNQGAFTNLKKILNKEQYMTTLCLLLNTSFINFVYVLQGFLLPIILSKQHSMSQQLHYMIMLLQATMGYFGNYISYILIDNEKYGGRKLLLVVFFGLIGLFSFALFFLQGNYEITFICLLRLCGQVTMSVNRILIGEVYDTNTRMTASGFINSVSRVISAASPYLIYLFMSLDGDLGPFLLQGFLALITILTVLPLKETNNMRLDHYKDSEESQQLK